MGTRESLQQPCVCDLRDACCSDDRCAQVVAEIAVAVKADIDRDRIRERLQVLEGWKLDADEYELSFIAVHEDYLKHRLDPGSIPRDKYDSIAWTGAMGEDDPQ